LIKISTASAFRDQIYLDEEKFVGGQGPIELQLGMLTGFEGYTEPVYKQIIIQEKT